MSKIKALAAASALALPMMAATQEASAEMFWMDNAVSVMQGSGYKFGDDDRTTYGFEHVSGHSWGDFVYFFDYQIGEDSGSNSTFHKAIGRLGTDVLGLDISGGPLKRTYLYANGEFPDHLSPTYNLGVSFDWDVPGFMNVETSLTHVEYLDGGQAQRLRIFPLASWDIAGQKVAFNGFFDFETADKNGTSEDNIQAQPRLLIDVGHALGGKEGKLQAGIEYQYWNNKFGVDAGEASDESTLQWIILYHL